MDKIPLQKETIMAADMLGVDPLHLANEGCLCIFVDKDRADEIIKLLRSKPFSYR
jgi:hydrogenase expression/formation protein HypE